MCGGGPNPDDFNKPTQQEYAMAETAAKEWNEYIKGKQVEEDYLRDVSKDPAETAAKITGTAVTDMAVQNPTPAVDPNRGMNVVPFVRKAGMRTKIAGDIAENTVSQQAAGKKAYVENAMGIQSTADTAQAGLAEEAVKRNISRAESDYTSSAAGMRTLTSLAGAGLTYGMATPTRPATK